MKNVKKTLSLILVAVMLLCSLPMVVSAAEYTQDGYTYTVADGKATITGSDDTINGDVTLPATLGGYPVVAIGDESFISNDSLTSVTIPSSVKSIGLLAFHDCTELSSVTLNNGLELIDICSFSHCYKLTKIDIPASVKRINDQAFDCCTNLATINFLGDNIEHLGVLAFNSTAWFDAQPDGDVYIGKCYYSYKGAMPENTTITIKDGTKCIGKSAFGYFNNLVSVVIPASVCEIGESAFAYCSNLSSVKFLGDDIKIGSYAFRDTPWFNALPDGDNYIGNCYYIYKGTMPENTTITIKDGTKHICDSAFEGMSQLVCVKIPDTVTSIGEFSFAYCTALTNVIIGNGVTTIGHEAFICPLKKVFISSSVTSIEDGALGYNFMNEYESTGRIKVDGFTIEGYAGTAAEKYALNNGFTFVEHSHADSDEDELCDTCGVSLKEPSALNDKIAKILAAVFEFIVFLVDAIIKLAQSSQGA